VNVLIVYAHPEPTSFNGALYALAREHLEARGHAVETSDLYAMGFNPVPGYADFDRPDDTAVFRIQVEQRKAAEDGSFAAALAAEQAKLARADALVFQFPLWWFGLPAILKGWIDRVFAFGWAYSRNERFDSGRFRGKRALVSVTTGSPAVRFAEGSLFAPMEALLYPFTVGTLNYVGIDVLPPFVAYGVGRVSDAERRDYLTAFRSRLDGIATETPLPFHSLSRFPDPLGETIVPG
jgi:NAD(P)H dehydrogenase (quinone)